MPIAAACVLLGGCRDQAAPPAASGAAPANPEAVRVSTELGTSLTEIINDATVRFQPLDYEYDEDLLKTIDQAEAYLSGKATGPAPRAMPKLDEKEEFDHLRETIRRWSAKTGKNLRTQIDQLKGEVAARKSSDAPFHPEFHKRFGAVFDDFIPIEVAELRERRNAYIHERAKPLLEKYRSTHPDLVRQQEAFLNQPPYNLAAPPSKGQ